MNLCITGPVGTLTFTHVRKVAAKTFGDFTPDNTEAIVRARIVVPVEGLIELKELIGRLIKSAPITPGTTASH